MAAARLTRRGRRALTAVVLAVLLVAGWFAVTRTPLGPALGLGDRPPCTLSTGRGELQWSVTQAMTATTVAGVGTRIGATGDGVAAAVGRALAVERDTALDADGARAVYRLLPEVAHPSPEELAVAQALLGGDGPRLSCVLPFRADDLPAEQPNGLGLTPRADAVRREMRAVFGKQILGGFAPDGVRSGHVEGSAHYEGRALDVFFRPVSAEHTRRGWQQAMWVAAHAQRLHVATVIFDRRIWSASRSVLAWRPYRYPGGETENPVLLHEDHVHVDVARGA